MMASLGNFKTLKISDARKNRRRTISEIDNFKNGPVSAVSIYSSEQMRHARTKQVLCISMNDNNYHPSKYDL